MEDVVRWVRELLDTGEHYPDLVALLVGTLVGYVFVLMSRGRTSRLLPTDDTRRRMKGLTFILTWLASGTASGILWAFLDPNDPPQMRVTISFLVSILSFPGYPLLAKLATAFMPSIGSAWAKEPPCP